VSKVELADIIGTIEGQLHLIGLLCLLLAGITWKFSVRARNSWMLPGLFVLFAVIIFSVSFRNEPSNGNDNSATQISIGKDSPNIIDRGSGSVVTITNENTSGVHSEKQTEQK